MPTSVADYIEQNRQQIIERWTAQAQQAEPARGLKAFELIDTLPEYLATLVAISRQGHRGDPAATRRRLEETHIGMRLRLGYNEAEVLWEYTLLGEIIAARWASQPPAEQPTPEDLKLFFDDLQDAMGQVVETFSGHSFEDVQAEKRFLRRMDQLAVATATSRREATSLEDWLEPLIVVLCEAMRAGGAAVLLAEDAGRSLRLAASVGRLREPAGEYTCPASGAGFGAQLAVSELPFHLPDAANAHVEVPPGLRTSGLRSVLGMRLWPHGELLGVVYFGVTEQRGFSPGERRRFETLSEHLAGLVEVRRLLEALRHNNAQLERERDVRERFVSVLAHDLRGPVSAARMAAAILVERPERLDTRRDLAAKIATNLDRTDAMVRDLLDANRLRAGERLPLRLAECDLGRLAAEVVEELTAVHGDRFRVDDPGAVRGVWSAGELRRALWNLASNGAKYGAPGTPVVLAVRGVAGGAEVAVHNAGAPIPAEEQRTLFEPFARTTAARSGTQGGWGLGLTLVKGCAEAHGGSVVVDSGPGRGTTFTLRLPLDARPFQAPG